MYIIEIYLYLTIKMFKVGLNLNQMYLSNLSCDSYHYLCPVLTKLTGMKFLLNNISIHFRKKKVTISFSIHQLTEAHTVYFSVYRTTKGLFINYRHSKANSIILKKNHQP